MKAMFPLFLIVGLIYASGAVAVLGAIEHRPVIYGSASFVLLIAAFFVLAVS